MAWWRRLLYEAAVTLLRGVKSASLVVVVVAALVVQASLAAEAIRLDVAGVADSQVAAAFVVTADGRYVVYANDREVLNAFRFYRVPIGGGMPTVLSPQPAYADGKVPGEVLLTPDSTRVVSTEKPLGRPSRLFSVPIDGTTIDRVELSGDIDPTGDLYSFQVDPTGLLVVYTANQVEFSPTWVPGYRAPVTGPAGVYETVWSRPFTEDRFLIGPGGGQVVIAGTNFLTGGTGPDQLWSAALAGELDTMAEELTTTSWTTGIEHLQLSPVETTPCSSATSMPTTEENFTR